MTTVVAVLAWLVGWLVARLCPEFLGLERMLIHDCLFSARPQGAGNKQASDCKGFETTVKQDQEVTLWDMVQVQRGLSL